jgi:hypothetical protein
MRYRFEVRKDGGSTKDDGWRCPTRGSISMITADTITA